MLNMKNKIEKRPCDDLKSITASGPCSAEISAMTSLSRVNSIAAPKA